MAQNELYINGKDAYQTWGMSLTDGSVSALMTPPPMKDYIENNDRTQHGRRILDKYIRKQARDLTLQVHFHASSQAAFLAAYEGFCAELANGWLTIRTKWQPTVYYRCVYVSCNQFSQFSMGLAKFSLKLNEPDPDNRGAADKHSTE